MNLYTFSILLLLALKSINGNVTIKDITENVFKLDGTHKNAYEHPSKRLSKILENDRLVYPRNNKVAETSRNWIKYYECLSHLAKSLTKSLQLPNMVLRVYSGSVGKIPCNLCVSPAEEDQIKWLYAPSIKNLSFDILIEKETAIQDFDLTIYYARFEDSGVYHCQLRNSFGGLVVLEVMDKEPYIVVKWKRSNESHTSPPIRISRDAVIFTSWSPWSECSRCDKVGRRRRYGICYVGLIDYDKYEVTEETNHNETENLLDDETSDLFHEYPNGIPCRSQILPVSLRNIPSLQARCNEIVIGLCRVPCKNNILEIRSQCGEVIEKVNNSAGIYSLTQKKPPQPPEIARDIIFVSPEDEVTIICPGTILRDIPVTWRKGTKILFSRDLVIGSGGTAYITARDHIIFRIVGYTDTAVYSCWQDDILAGVVKLVVRNNPETVYKRRFVLLSAIFILAMLLKRTIRYLHHR